jgi:hypothetical protein
MILILISRGLDEGEGLVVMFVWFRFVSVFMLSFGDVSLVYVKLLVMVSFA